MVYLCNLSRYLCIAGSDPQRRSVDNIKPEITAIKNNNKEIISIFTKLSSVCIIFVLLKI